MNDNRHITEQKSPSLVINPFFLSLASAFISNIFNF